MEPEKKYVVVAYTQLYSKPTFSSGKICDLIKGTIILYNEIADVKDENGLLWHNVIYRTNFQIFLGYLPDYLLEPFFSSLVESNVIKIKNATQSDSDFSQDIIVKGNILFNLCGEFSVLYCAGWREFDIEDWLDEWKIKSPSYFNRIFYGGRSKPTSLDDITNMFQSFENYPKIFKTIAESFVFRDKIIFSPYKVLEILKTNRLLIGCKIEGQYGRLRQSGIPHWVVLERIFPLARGGTVDIFNPATNSVESDYSWDDLIASCGQIPYGIAISRY